MNPAECAGNNPYGSLGRQKCDACRTRRKKCEYDESRPDVACVYCAKHGQSTCMKVFSRAQNNIPSPMEINIPTEFRLSEICDYYERLYPASSHAEIIEHLRRHVQRVAEQEQEDMAAAAQQQQQQPQQQYPPPPDAQYGYGGAQAQYPAMGVNQYGQPTYAPDPTQQGFGGVVDPNLLHTQQTQQMQSMYYPQQQQSWQGYGGGSFM